MNKWEYIIAKYSDGDMQSILNEFGKQGWELCATETTWSSRIFYFKRPYTLQPAGEGR